MRPSLIPIYILIVLVVLQCNHKEKANEAGKPLEAGGTEILEKEVMEIHDEVMPRMGELYAWKTRLKTRLDSAGVSDEQKKEMALTISQLDSAYDGMMTWMHEYNPPSDSISEERAREYLENEMEKIKKVREDIVTVLEKAESISKAP